MKRLLLATAIAALPLAAAAEVVKVAATDDVTATMDALEAAVTGAGATVFARVDHTAGAESVGLEMTDAELLIFGNPKLGTPAMQDDPLAGLYLPLRVLVYSDDAGQTWLAYDDPAAMLSGLNIQADAGYLETMTGALGKLTGAAAGN